MFLANAIFLSGFNIPVFYFSFQSINIDFMAFLIILSFGMNSVFINILYLIYGIGTGVPQEFFKLRQTVFKIF